MFIVGGACYEEAKIVAQFNALNSGVSVLLGGSTILNARTFIKNMLQIQESER